MSSLRSSERLQRFLGGSVAALLTANAFAVAVLLDDGDSGDRLRRPAATEEGLAPALDAPTVTLITSRDGRTFVADPSTAEGRRAIEQARRDGSTLRDITVPARTPSSKPGSTITIPTALGGDGLLDLGELIDGLAGADLPGDDGDLLDDLVDDPVGTVTSIVDDTRTTVTSVVDDTKTTVSSIVKSTPTTVTSVLDDTKTTVTSIVSDTETTVSSIVGQLPVTTAPPATSAPTTTGVVGGAVTTVVGLLEGSTSTSTSTSTTSAPTTTTAPPTDPVCTLLVSC